jgi:hypothetical protein
VALQDDEFGDGIAPALSAAASVGRWPVMVHRPGCGTSGAVPGLSLGIGQRSVAERLAGHGLTPKRYVTEPGSRFLDETSGDQARCLEAPALVAALDDLASWWLRRSSNTVVISGQAAAIFGAFCLRKLSPLSCRR